METENLNSMPETTRAPGLPTVKIFGVGNAGGTLLSTLATPEFAGVTFAAINTDAAALATVPATMKIHLETKLLRGLGSGGDPDRGRALAEEQFSTLKSACAGAEVVFIIAGLGGGAGSGISPVLARAAREAGALVLAFVTRPFECEGNRREEQAQAALDQLKTAADGVICLPNQKIFRLIDENTSVLDTFRVTGGFLIEGVRGVWQLVARPGLIQVHFADLCALLRDGHTESAFAFVEASGPARSREAVEKILAHPLFDDGRALVESDAVLVSLKAGKDLSMAEISRVMEQIKRQCARAKIIMGAAVDPEFKNRLCVTVIAARESGQANAAPTRPETGALLVPVSARRGPAADASARKRAVIKKAVQGQLPLNIVAKGRFDKSEPTLHRGEDLDVPTFIRRGLALN
jgi:cell division protein FtsZ